MTEMRLVFLLLVLCTGAIAQDINLKTHHHFDGTDTLDTTFSVVANDDGTVSTSATFRWWAGTLGSASVHGTPSMEDLGGGWCYSKLEREVEVGGPLGPARLITVEWIFNKWIGTVIYTATIVDVYGLVPTVMLDEVYQL